MSASGRQGYQGCRDRTISYIEEPGVRFCTQIYKYTNTNTNTNTKDVEIGWMRVDHQLYRGAWCEVLTSNTQIHKYTNTNTNTNTKYVEIGWMRVDHQLYRGAWCEVLHSANNRIYITA